MEKPERKRSVGRFRHRWEDYTEVDLREMGGMEWIHLAEDRVN